MGIKKSIDKFFEAIEESFEAEQQLSVMPLMAFVCGVLFYFGLSFEPNIKTVGALVFFGIGFCLIPCSRVRKILFQLTPLFFCIGVLVVCIHTRMITTRFIPHAALNVYVSGIVTAVRPRLDRVIVDLKPTEIYNVDEKTGNHQPVYKQEDYPSQVRLTIYRQHLTLKKGDKLTGLVFKLTQPAPAITPYSSGRNIVFWFEGIGAVGSMRRFYVEKSSSEEIKQSDILEPLRTRIHHVFHQNFQTENAGIAEALVLGGTDFVTASARDLYRRLGLSHILSVSGFHIGLVMLLVFSCVRLLFCLLPDIISAVFVKRLAAIVALIIGGLYVILSQAHAPAVRAYLMAVFIFTAILFDRRALSVRNVFMAAVMMLFLMPHLILSASFQLSFAAILCLVGIWNSVQNYLNNKKTKSFWVRLVIAFVSFLILNVMITFVTLPFVSYHFHQIQLYGILGNFLFGSLFAFVIIPLLFVAVLLIETPLAPLILQGADKLLSYVNMMGMPMTEWPYATLTVPYFHTYGFVLWGIGLMGVSLFKTRLRWLFIVLMLFIFPSFIGVEKPVAVIGAGGNYIGYYKDETYFVTESYYYPQWHSAFLLFNHHTPTTVIPQRFKRDYLKIGSFELNQTVTECQKSSLNIYRQKMENCPHLIRVEDMLDLYSILVFKNKNELKLYIGGYAQKERPWHINTRQLPIMKKQIRIMP